MERHDSPLSSEPTLPSAARMWDYYLGGTHNFAIDRQIAQEVLKVYPDANSCILENRSFLRRAVRHLARNGVTQFIDIGCGLPLVGSTHEAVLAVAPEAKVLYVDNDDSVVGVGRNSIDQMGHVGQVGMIKASALEPECIVDDMETIRLIDFKKPVAVLMLALIHFFQPEQCTPMLVFWKSYLPRGSALVLSHVTQDGGDRERLSQAEEVYSRTPIPAIFRSRQEIETMMDGWDVMEPGIVRPEAWRIDELDEREEEPPRTNIWWAGVGKLH